MPTPTRPVSTTTRTTPTAAPGDDAAEGEVEVKPSAKVDDAVRTAVQKKAADRLLGVVQRTKDVKGTGVETAGTGDPRITERRSAISTLIAAKKSQHVDAAALEGLSPQVKADLRWLRDADRRDYELDKRGQFGWSLSNMSNAAQMEGEFKARVAAGRQQAKDIAEGTKRVLDAKDGSVIGIAFLEDQSRRTAALADVLLQFRAATGDEKNTDDTRIDRIGPALVAEQRVLLAGTKLDLDDPEKVREYALLREVVASHPTSSVNSIFDARNAVGAMYHDAQSGSSNDLDWVQNDIPPGATASAYKSIHHNFSKQTPQNIEKFIAEFVFRLGKDADRPAIFLRLVDALSMAAAGDAEAAKDLLASFDKPEQKAVVAPLLDKVKDLPAAEDVRARILELLKVASIGDWAKFPKQYKIGAGAGEPEREKAQRLIRAYQSAVKGDFDSARSSVVREIPSVMGAAILKQLLVGLDDIPDEKLAEHLGTLRERPELKALPDTEKQGILAALSSAQERADDYKTVAAAMETLDKSLKGVDNAAAVLAAAGTTDDELKKAVEDFFARPEIKSISYYDGEVSAVRSVKDMLEKRIDEPKARGALAAFEKLKVAVEDVVPKLDAVEDGKLKEELQKVADACSADLPSDLKEIFTDAYSTITQSWRDPKATDFEQARASLRDLVERFGVHAVLLKELAGKKPEEWPDVYDVVKASKEYEALSLSQQATMDKELDEVRKTTDCAAPGVVGRQKLQLTVDAGKIVKEHADKYRGLAPRDVAAIVAADLKEMTEETPAKKLAKKMVDDGDGQFQYCRRALEARQKLDGFLGSVDMFQPLLAQLAGASDAKLAGILKTFLDKNLTKFLGEHEEDNLVMAARIVRAVCQGQPTAASLEASLFKAGDAVPEVADVIAQMTAGDVLGTLRELGEARSALRDAIVASKTGFERQELMLFDAQLARLTCEELGASVERTGDLTTNEQKAEALVAVQTALRAAIASGLHELRDPADPAARKGRSLVEVLQDVDAALAGGKVKEDAYRALMCDVSIQVARTVQNIRAFMDVRSAELADAGITCDWQFIDQFVKQSPLHYATALAEKGMRVGLKEKWIKDANGKVRGLENIAGMRVLNGIGPVVFRSAVCAENSKDLAQMGVQKDQLAVLFQLEEKKMVAVGGLIVDTKNAPGGNSHLNMYAMNNGIPVVALPELRANYFEFFRNAEQEGGIYIDDTGAEFRMMTVQCAVEMGLLKVDPPKDDAAIKAAADKLRPGMNRNITFLRPTSDATAFEIAAKHDATISAQRGTRQVEIYLPQDEVKGIGKTCPTWDELAGLGIFARHVAGEKGTVLALLSAHPELGKYVPKGSQVTPAVIKDMLSVAKDDAGKSLLDLWQSTWSDDPAVGVVDDANFTRSAFYTDAQYRRQKRETLQAQTKDLLTKALLKDGPDGPVLTEEGQRFYDQLLRNPALFTEKCWILRSSFTAEDRPGKSGAGQYESYVDRKLLNDVQKDKVDALHKKVDAAQKALADLEAQQGAPAADVDAARKALTDAQAERNAFMGPARVEALIGVIESTWMAEPIENNVAEQFFLKHVGPTIAVQQTVDPDISGVMISRNLETGGRQEVTFQLVPGFGGGVEGGKTSEGVISQGGVRVSMTNGDAATGKDVKVGAVDVTPESMAELRDIVLKTEKYFNEVVEKGKRYAVDMEVARDKVNGWKIVQARVILVDK